MNLKRFILVFAFVICGGETQKILVTANFPVSSTILEATSQPILQLCGNLSKINYNIIEWVGIDSHQDINNYFQRIMPLKRENVTGIFGSYDYYIDNLQLSIPAPDAMGSYFSGFDIELETSLMIITSYLDMTRVSQNAYPEQYLEEYTLLITEAKYTSRSTPYSASDLMFQLNKIKGRVEIQLMRDSAEAASIAEMLALRRPINIVALLPSDLLNALLSAVKQYNLFDWHYRWLIFLRYSAPSDINIGGMITHANITLMVPGKTSSFSRRGDDRFTADLATVSAYHALKLSCPSLFQTENPSTDLETGTFTFDFTCINSSKVYLRTSYNVLIYKSIGGGASPTGISTDLQGKILTAINLSQFASVNMSEDAILARLQSRGLKLALAISAPLVMKKKDASRIADTTDRYEGLIYDMVKLSLRNSSIPFEVYEIPNSGATLLMQEAIFKEVVSRRADLGIGNLVVNTDTEVDYVMNFQFFSYAILMNNQTNFDAFDMFYFLQVVDYTIWIAVLVAGILVAVALYFLNLINKNRMDLDIYDTFYISFGYLLHGLTAVIPNRTSSRILISFWWMFCLLFVIMYATNFGALLVKNKLSEDVTDFKDLPQSALPFGWLAGSGAESAITTSTQEVMKKITLLTRDLRTDTIKPNLSSVIDAVQSKNFMFIGDSLTLDYLAKENCFKVVGQFQPQEYGILLRKDSSSLPFMQRSINSLKRTNALESLKKKYISVFNPQCAVHPHIFAQKYKMRGFFRFGRKELPNQLGLSCKS
ncbi:hypothetical protein Ciccas_001238 [Cichlidogyrus casuarinus]|uniref:Ionotropic glutamate receptor C-terminal domain-containing protein n=1 Tax=Cichlidogyrus casuarinus TaxID=1844966 RepID=A0ABD2QKP3_9PLAT